MMVFAQRAIVLVLLFVCLRPAEAAPPCAGDCDLVGTVTVDELVKGVGIALGSTSVTQCTAADSSGNGNVTVDELVAAVNNALNGCPDFIGEYLGTVQLDGSRSATMLLTTEPNGEATGEVTISDGAGLVALLTGGSGAAPMNIAVFGTIDLDTGAYSVSGSYMEGEETIPINASGTLPLQPGGQGTFNFQLGDQVFNGSIAAFNGSTPGPTHAAGTPTATPTQAGPTPTQPSRPTPAAGCGGGYGVATFSDVSGVNANQSLANPAEFTKAEGNLSVIGAFNGLGVALNKCPIEVNGITRTLDFSVSGSTAVAAGMTYQVGSLTSRLNYREGTATPSLQTWTATSGTVTIDALNEDTVTFHLSAQMGPGAVYPFGPPATGTFTLTATGTVDHLWIIKP